MYPVNPPLAVLLAQVVEGSGPVVFLIGLLLGLSIFVGSIVLVRRINRQEPGPALPPGTEEGAKSGSTERPVVDPLADREETEAPVEITEGMSLKDIKKAKRARLTQEFKAGEGGASVRAQRRAGARPGESAPEHGAEAGQEEVERSAAVAATEETSGAEPSDAPVTQASDEAVAVEEAPQKTLLFSHVSRDVPGEAPADAASSAPAPAAEKVPASELPDDWSLEDEDGAAPVAPPSAPAPALPAPPPGRFAARTGRVAPTEPSEPEAPAVAAAEVEAEAPARAAADEREQDVAGGGPDSLGEEGPVEEAGAERASDEATAKAPSAVDVPNDAPVADPAPVPDAAETAEPETETQPSAEEGRSVRDGLDRTRGGFIARLGTIFSRGRKLTEDQIEEIEEVLFTADVGVKTSQHLLEMVQTRVDEGVESSEIWRVLREETSRILRANERPLDLGDHKPVVLLVVGVNGVGKTTTIGKMAAQWTRDGKRVLMVAADTFRAAAVEQLREWSERVGCGFSCGKDNADPSGVVFDGVRMGVDEGYDIILCDTAGRLHTKTPLIDELRKIRRSVDKAHPGAPHEVILVLDANTGQNAIAQARQFREAVDLTGLVLTKLDGTAKGGVIIGISAELSLPVYFIGIGEAVEDLRAFDAEEFVDALFS